jgi:hypothetical protein
MLQLTIHPHLQHTDNKKNFWPVFTGAGFSEQVSCEVFSSGHSAVSGKEKLRKADSDDLFLCIPLFWHAIYF